MFVHGLVVPRTYLVNGCSSGQNFTCCCDTSSSAASFRGQAETEVAARFYLPPAELPVTRSHLRERMFPYQIAQQSYNVTRHICSQGVVNAFKLLVDLSFFAMLTGRGDFPIQGDHYALPKFAVGQTVLKVPSLSESWRARSPIPDKFVFFSQARPILS